MSAARPIAMAAAAGIAYALSPLTAWLALAIGLIVRRAFRGVVGAERRAVLGVFAVGLAIRLAAIAWLVLATPPGSTNNPSFFGDGSYAVGRSLWLRSVWLGEPVHPRYFMEAFDEYGGGGHNYFHAVVQSFVGPAPLALHLLAATVFLLGTAILYRLVRASFGPVASTAAFAGIWLLPSWIAWSITPIKDGLQFTFVAVAIACVVHAVHGMGASRLLTGAGAVAAGAVVATLRVGGGVMMAAMVSAGLICAALLRWRARAAAAFAAAAVVVIAWGPLEIAQQRVSDEIVSAVNRHLGHVRTEGTYFKLLDERLYHVQLNQRVEPDDAEKLRFVLRASAAFVLVPLPWQVETIPGLLYLPAQLLWYAIVALAVVGAPAAFRQQPVLTTLLVGYIGVSLAIIAPNSGNVGTLVRHRDSVVPFVICLSGAGAQTLLARRRVGLPLPRREFA